MTAQGIAVAAASETRLRGSTVGKSPVDDSPCARSVRGLALDLMNAAEVLREQMTTSLSLRDQMDARWAARAIRYADGLSSQATEPKVSALRVSIPIAGERK